jgi:hypothetical protein
MAKPLENETTKKLFVKKKLSEKIIEMISNCRN